MSKRYVAPLPQHPGDFLTKTVMVALRLNFSELAEAVSQSRPAVSDMLNQKTSCTPEMALRFEKAFGKLCGFRADDLVLMQARYDMAAVRASSRDIDVKAFIAKPDEPEPQGKLL